METAFTFLKATHHLRNHNGLIIDRYWRRQWLEQVNHYILILNQAPLMLSVNSMKYAITKFSAWNATNPTPKHITIFFGNDILFHQERVFFDAVPHDEQ